jgi:hypothetical protein
LDRPALPRGAFLSVWDLVPTDIFETSLEAVDEYAELPPESAYLPKQSSLRVAQAYWNVCARQGLSH